MKQLHNQEKEQFKKLFKEEQIDRFEDRFKILEVFLKTERHVTISQLVQLIKDSGNHFDSDFVRDTLKRMCSYGFAQKNSFKNGEVRYEHRHLGQHHDHMICTKCKKITEFKNNHLENLQAQIASANGFHMLQHRMEIYGICSECLKTQVQLMPLSMAKPGELLRIKEITGGSNVRMRLSSMGLKPGDIIEIITNKSKGQLVVALDFNRLVLGRGLAEKILVQHSDNRTLTNY